MKLVSLILALTFWSAGAFAGALSPWSSSFNWVTTIKWAAEIVIPAEGLGRAGVSSPSESRRKAQAYSKDSPDTAVPAVVVPDDELESLFAPSRMGAPEDNRAKAKEYSRDSEADTAFPVKRLQLDVMPNPIDMTGSQLKKNLNKAKSYSEGGTASFARAGTYVKIGTAVGVVGVDGVVVVQCDEINNTAGRVGDDTQSGSVFSISIGGKLARARCK